MVTKNGTDMIKLHTHTHTHLDSKNTNKNEITREESALKNIYTDTRNSTSDFYV